MNRNNTNSNSNSHDVSSTTTTMRMSDCLNQDDPVAALLNVSKQSFALAHQQTLELQEYIQSLNNKESPILDESTFNWKPILGSAESVHVSLDKIASGGSQASQDIRLLETEKLQLDQHAQVLELALQLRHARDRATSSVAGSAWHDAADALQVYLLHPNHNDDRLTDYAGRFTLQSLQSTYETLKEKVLQKYQESVQAQNLQALGSLTPILNSLKMEREGWLLYKQFVQDLLTSKLDAIVNQPPPNDAPPYYRTTKLYNTGVSVLRHHLPMTSQCLYRAEGAAHLLTLVFDVTQSYALKELQHYQTTKQLIQVSATAQDVYETVLEAFDSDDPQHNIAQLIGTLSDIDHSMEEVAKFIQYSTSFWNFCVSTKVEINKSRQLRHQQAAALQAQRREQHEWETGQKWSKEDDNEAEYSDLEILPPSTQLSEQIAELASHYSVIERCLLTCSIQKAYLNGDYSDPKYYRALSIVDQDGFLQTSLIESIVFLSRRSLQRAFLTLHVLSASTMTNFVVELLNHLATILSSRAQELGVQALKPGDGLLGGHHNIIYNAQNLIKKDESVVERLKKQKQVTTQIAQSCGIINDLEVAIHHIQSLEKLLNKHIERGFANHTPEALSLCVKNLSSSADVFKMNSTVVVESLESILKPRIRAIVGEAVGSETTNALISMAGATKATEVVVRMNYNLDEGTYEMMQLSESYVTSLCGALDDLLEPLKRHLAPRLWDHLLFAIMTTACKRLETSLKKCHFTSLGAIALEHDLRDILNYIKDKLDQNPSNAVVFQNVPVLSKLLQIANLLTVDNLDDVLDFMKSKTNWEVSREEAKQYLLAKVEFDELSVQEVFAD